MRSVRALRAFALALLAAAPSAALAQRAPTRDTLPASLLEGLVVTTRRAPTLRERIPQKVEVVTRADLDRTVAADLADVLKKNQSVDVIQYPGLLSGVSVRGFRPQISGINQRTLLLVDGRPAGVTNLGTLDPAAVERIEILKGPASALYGSSAMGGVVNVVTRASTGTPRGRASASYGSFGQYRGELAVGGTLAGPLDFDLALASAGQAHGYEVGRHRLLGADSVTKTLAAGGTVRLAELEVDSALTFSEHASRSGTLRLGYALGAGWRASARAELFRADEVQNPGDLTALYDSRSLKDLERRAGEVGLGGEIGRHAVSLRGYASREDAGFYSSVSDSRFVSFRTPTTWYGAQLQDALSLGAHSLTAGLDFTAAEARSEAFRAAGEPGAPFSPNSGIYSAAAFAETRVALYGDRLVATLGGRIDRVAFSVKETPLLAGHAANRETHTVFNPSAGLLYRAPGGLRLHASGGRSFVTPEAFSVAGYAEVGGGSGAVRVTRGNPALDPESGVSWDAGLGVRRSRAGIEADLTYFHTDVRHRIATVPGVLTPGERTPGGDLIAAVVTYANADEAEIRGIEARASYDLGALSGFDRSLRLFADATRILRAEETTGSLTTAIKQVADLSAVFGLEYDDLRLLSGRFAGRYVGERWDTDWSDFSNPGDVRYPAFLVFDLSASLRLAERYRLGAQLGNLTDENYYEVRGYNLPGRTVRLQLGVDF